MKYEDRKKITEAYKLIYRGRFDSVNEIINKILSESTEDAELYKNIGLLYSAMKQYKFAAVYMRQSFDLEKSYETLEMLADINFNAEKYDFSAIQYEELIKNEPSELGYERCIESYKRLDYYEEAIRVAKMYNIATGSDISYAKLIYMYITAGMEDLAIETTQEMAEKFPNNSLTYNTQGFLYECIYNDYEKAKEYFKKAAKHGFIDAYCNLGICCKQSEDFVNAEKYLKRLINLKTDISIDYNYTLGTIYLANRKMGIGYKYYSKRKNVLKQKEQFKNNLWDGKAYPDEILLISAEQGFGDTIQFVRYIPMTLKYFKRVIFATTENLVELFKRSFPEKDYPNLEIVSNEGVTKFNKFVYIMDLPYVLHQNFHNIPAKKSYLVPDKRNKNLMKNNYFNNDDIKIGLCWKAKGMSLRDAVYRTIDAPYYFKRLFDIPNISFYSFQVGDIFKMLEKYPQIKDLSKEMKNFSAVADMLVNLDIFITVDTSLAHLAGALGVKTYLLLCHAPDWRWFDNTEKTEWYPSVTIIKQNDRRTWQDVSDKLFDCIKKDVKKFSKS